MSTIKVNNITAFSGTYVQIAKNTEVTGTLRASSNISGTADVNVHRISGSVRGMTTLGSAIFSHATSIKTSGSISSATTISGAASLSAASLTINGTERISQNGNAIFVALTADTLDVREINNTSVTTTTLEVADKLIIVASGSNASNTNQAGVQFGGTDGSNAISSILWENSNSRLSSSTAFYVGGAFAAAGNISGAADLTVNRISGSARGMTTLGSAIFSHATSIKASGSIAAAGNISGTADLTVNRISGSERGAVIHGPVILSKPYNNPVAGLIVSGNAHFGTPVANSGEMVIITNNTGSTQDACLIEQKDAGFALNVQSVGDTWATTTTGKWALRAIATAGGQAGGGQGLRVWRNINETGSYPMVYFDDDHTSNTQTTLKVKQDGTGDILGLFDGTTEVFSVADGGNVEITGSLFATGRTNLIGNSSSVDLVVKDNYNTVLYGPLTVVAGAVLNIPSTSNVKIINIADV